MVSAKQVVGMKVERGYKQWFEVGVLVRRDFRRLCMKLGLDYQEEKGWLDSFFLITTDDKEALSKLNEIVGK